MRVIACMILAALVACSAATTTPSSNSLTIRGGVNSSQSSAARIARSSAVRFGQQTRPGMTFGDPASISVGMYALYISESGDCSNATLVQDYGAQAAVKDFMQSPTLFAGSPAPATYRCIGVKMSDVIAFSPSATFGSCSAGQTYRTDIYRNDNTDLSDTASWFKDINLHPIEPHGTDAAPVDDRVVIIFTRDTAAAVARGFSPSQTIQLSSPLVVPGTQTFVWGGAGTVVSDSISGTCGLNPGRPSFE